MATIVGHWLRRRPEVWADQAAALLKIFPPLASGVRTVGLAICQAAVWPLRSCSNVTLSDCTTSVLLKASEGSPCCVGMTTVWTSLAFMAPSAR